MEGLGKLNNYRRILGEIVAKHAALMARRSNGVDVLPLCHAEHDSYMVLRVGWDVTGRVHYIMLHLRLRDDGKVWIEQDGIEYGIYQDLLAAGIPAEDICFADREPQPVPLTELLAA